VILKEFFWFAQSIHWAIKITYHTITFYPCSQKSWILLCLKANPWANGAWKFQKIKIKIPLVVRYPHYVAKKTFFRPWLLKTIMCYTFIQKLGSKIRSLLEKSIGKDGI